MGGWMGSLPVEWFYGGWTDRGLIDRREAEDT